MLLLQILLELFLLGNDMVKDYYEENSDGDIVTHVYTLVPVKLKGINGDITITSAEI